MNALYNAVPAALPESEEKGGIKIFE